MWPAEKKLWWLDDHDLPTIDVHVTDPHLVGQLHHPDGRVLVTVYDRTVLPFGFQRPR